MMRRMPGWVTAGLVLLCGSVWAQDGVRGTQVDAKSGPVPEGKRYVMAIGIDHYESWPKLETAVSDAMGFAKLLHDQFGYELAAAPLVEAEAKQRAIVSLIDDDLRQKLKPEDELVLFFAGHGKTRVDVVGEAKSEVGFLIPYEARRSGGETEHWSDYIEIDELLRKVSTLPARRILVILDSCHSGMALGSGFTSTRDEGRFEKDMARKMSRKVITSAQGDQTAADHGPVAGHSLFTGLLMQGLESGKADRFNDGLITASQLGAYAQHEVSVAAGSRQTPLFGAFALDGGGEVLFPVKSDFQALYGQALNALMVPDNAGFLAKATQAVALRPESVQAGWLRYRTDLMTGKASEAVGELRRLSQRFDAEHFTDALPLDVRPRYAGGLAARISYRTEMFGLPEASAREANDVALLVHGTFVDGGPATRMVVPGAVMTLVRGSTFVAVATNCSGHPLSVGLVGVTSGGDVEAESAVRVVQKAKPNSGYNPYGGGFGESVAYRSGDGPWTEGLEIGEFYQNGCEQVAGGKRLGPPEDTLKPGETQSMADYFKNLGAATKEQMAAQDAWAAKYASPLWRDIGLPADSVMVWRLQQSGEVDAITYSLVVSPAAVEGLDGVQSHFANGASTPLELGGAKRVMFSLRFVDGSDQKGPK